MPSSAEISPGMPAPTSGGTGKELLPKPVPPPAEFRRATHERSLRHPEQERRRYIVIITRDDERTRRLEKLPRLFGSAIRYDRQDGTIYYPSYHARKRILKPEIYRVEYPRELRLRHQRVSSSAYLEKIPTHRPFLWEKRWNRILKEDGSVETALRAMDHILEGFLIPDGDEERGKEIRQIYGSIERISAISNLLEIYEPGMPREKFNELFAAAAEETAQLFVNLGMGGAKDPAKQKIIEQLLKASKGKDSLGRPNPLIMATRLNSARLVAINRLEKANFIRTKYWEMRIALANERRTARYLLRVQKREISTVLDHVAFKHPEKSTTRLQLGAIGGIIGRITRETDNGIHLKPYKITSLKIRFLLIPNARKLLNEGNVAEAEKVIREIQAEIDRVLETYRRIYPEEPRGEEKLPSA